MRTTQAWGGMPPEKSRRGRTPPPAEPLPAANNPREVCTAKKPKLPRAAATTARMKTTPNHTEHEQRAQTARANRKFPRKHSPQRNNDAQTRPMEQTAAPATDLLN